MILKSITVSLVSILTYPVWSAVLHSKLTSWTSRATGSNPPVSRSSAGRNRHASAWLLSGACPAYVSLLQNGMNFKRPKHEWFHLSISCSLFSQNMRCTWSIVHARQVPTFPSSKHVGRVERKHTPLCLLGLLLVTIVTRWGHQFPGRTDTCCIIHLCNA